MPVLEVDVEELEEVVEVVESSLLVLSRPSRLLWDSSSGLILL